MGDEEDSEKKTATTNQQQRISDSSISKLSRDVVKVIFCKLPVESLMYCRCVCKAWRYLILDPVFGGLHLTTAPSILIFQFGGFWKPISTHMVEPETCYHDAITKDNIGFQIPKLNGMRIIGSCNGLLCLYGDRGDFFHVSNPITGEFMSLPKTLTEWANNFVSGFGFSSKTNQYKVMKEYGVKESWTKELVIKDSTAHISHGDIWLQLIQHSRNDESLMLSCGKNLISYNPRTGSLRNLCFNQSGIEVFPHTPSFLSLENIVMGDSSKVFNVPRRYKICCS
ncbi:hypothetical protein L1049_001685 [Liquidambar formosana]|uniref:F-box domain-containing protein n=1 Tax=Liquidambar formosana TaxID=63359 RepID=A0AAP0N8D7_LIQFO